MTSDTSNHAETPAPAAATTTADTTRDVPPAGTPTSPFSGFWRRVAAFCFDVLVLGVVGYALGWLFFDAFAALGGWGRLVGFAIAWPYFGLLNSRLGRGQTLGKRMLHLQVVRLDGTLLSPQQGLLRSAVLCAAWFLNGAAYSGELLASLPMLLVLSLLVFGVTFSQAYLLVFNRPSRQVLHDWAAGSAVVRVPLPPGASLSAGGWRGHRVVVGVLAVLALAVPFWTQGLMQSETFAPLMAVQATAEAQPGVRHAGAMRGSSHVVSTGQGSRTTTYFTVSAVADAPDVDLPALTDRLARAVLQRNAEVGDVDVLVVNVSYGYDIGIASALRTSSRSLSPAQWRERFTQ